MNFYSPLALLSLLGLIPIIIMYLLKKQHEDVYISSNYLWQRAIKDIEANKPWQKLKKNLLLILQLVIFTVLALALSKPYIFSDGLGDGNLVIVIDTSASMKANYNKSTRLETAKEEVKGIIDNLSPESSLTLISMDKSPKVIASSTNDKNLLKSRLASIRASDASDNMGETLSLLRAITKEDENTRIILYTDKPVDHDIDNMMVEVITSQVSNIAIDNIGHSHRDGSISILVTVTNYSDSPLSSDLIIYGDNNIIDVREIHLEGNESKDIYFYNLPTDIRIITAELDAEDDFSADNLRYHVISKNEINRVLLATESNVFLEKALSISEGVELYKTKDILEDLSGYDLYVFDSILPKNLPRDGNIVIFNPPLNGNFHIKNMITSGELKFYEDELFQYVDLDFYIRQVKSFDAPSWAAPIIEIDGEVIGIKGQRDNQRFIVLGFDLKDTDLPLRVDFPIFVQNILEYSLKAYSQEETTMLSGERVNINTSPRAKEVYIINPNGEKTKIGPPFPLAPFEDSLIEGIYLIQQIVEDDVIEDYFAVNIDTKNESLVHYENHEENKNINIKTGNVQRSKSLTKILLLIAITFLTIEWVVYRRGY